MQRPLNPQAFISGARNLVGLGRQAGTADGTLVDDMRRESELAADESWDLAFVHHVGWHSHRLGSGGVSTWPFPRMARHEELVSVARSHGLAVRRPDEGDIVLYWSDVHKRHVRAGIVVGLSVESIDKAGRSTFHCVTIEVVPVVAMVADEAQPPCAGWVREREVPICPARGDLLVRWTRSDARQGKIDGRFKTAQPRAPWEYDEQLGRVA